LPRFRVPVEERIFFSSTKTSVGISGSEPVAIIIFLDLTISEFVLLTISTSLLLIIFANPFL
jgi:hypothetical protein